MQETTNACVRRVTDFNRETVEAMQEAVRVARDPKAKKYTDMDELFRDLETEE